MIVWWPSAQWWGNKYQDALRACNVIISDIKRKEILTCSTTRMTSKNITLSEISQSKKDEYI